MKTGLKNIEVIFLKNFTRAFSQFLGKLVRGFNEKVFDCDFFVDFRV